jgi:hypothetical protein
VKGGEVTRVRSWERAETVEQNDRWKVSELTAAMKDMAAKVNK